MNMNRRDWLGGTAASLGVGALLPATRLWAAPTGGSRLVFVMLRGACDGLSVLSPYTEPFYYEARPGIAIARPGSGEALAGSRLDGRWALHPALVPSAGELYAARELAFVPFCGTGFVSRSHFQAQDWLETGKLPEQRPDVGDGFMNRLAQQMGGQAVSFTENLPVALRGARQVVNASVRLGRARELGQGFSEQVLAMYKGHDLEPLVSEGLGLRRELAQELREEMDSSSREAMGAAGFATEARRVARYMNEHPELSLAFIDVGGWDTHAAQGAGQGALAGRLSGLGQGLEDMAQELGAGWERTVVVVLSEFGRTFRENGSRGTDHGHGGLMWVAGGAVSGGQVRGEQADLSAAKLHQGRDVPVLNEYRDVLGGVFRRLFGLKAPALEQVFPGSRPVDLKLL